VRGTPGRIFQGGQPVVSQIEGRVEEATWSPQANRWFAVWVDKGRAMELVERLWRERRLQSFAVEPAE